MEGEFTHSLGAPNTGKRAKRLTSPGACQRSNDSVTAAQNDLYPVTVGAVLDEAISRTPGSGTPFGRALDNCSGKISQHIAVHQSLTSPAQKTRPPGTTPSSVLLKMPHNGPQVYLESLKILEPRAWFFLCVDLLRARPDLTTCPPALAYDCL